MSDARIKLRWLDPRDPDEAFPDPVEALHEPGGLLAIGGDLSITRLLRAYSNGIFPWYNPDEPILWWSPEPRTVLEPARLHRSRSLRRAIRRQDFAITVDERFHDVIAGCSGPRRHQDGTWLGPDMIQAFAAMHAAGHAHAIAVWRDGRLIGGVYGVAIGHAYFGESMFSLEPDASKLALHYLALQLERWDFPIIDCQVSSPHLLSLGAVEWPRRRFIAELRAGVARRRPPGRWQFDIDLPQDRVHLPSDWS